MTPNQNPWIVLHALGIVPTLVLSSEEVPRLTADDVALLREIGATDAMLDRLRALAREPNRLLAVDFERQTVAIDTQM